MTHRYKVVKGSESAHCCFEATIVDTKRHVLIRGEPYIRDSAPVFETIAECFSIEDAELVCAALNEMNDRAAKP